MHIEREFKTVSKRYTSLKIKENDTHEIEMPP